MGILSNEVERSKIRAGDHIYTWRIIYAYSHHGIYVGGSKVVHFTRDEEDEPPLTIETSLNSSESSSKPSSNINPLNYSRSSSKPPSNINSFTSFGSSSKPPSNINPINSFGSSSKLPSSFNSFNSFGSSSRPPSSFKSFNSSGSSSNLPSNSNSFNSFGSSLPSTCQTFPDCGFKQPNSGVVLSCLDCFLGNGKLYLFDYGVTPSAFIAKLRGGTCTIADSDTPDIVIHRAMYLLQKGFGNYDILLNNCEDFALYCKTGLLTLDKSGVGGSGQASAVIGAPLAAVLFSPLKVLMPGPVGIALTAGMYCMSRYATDIGIRSDVIKVSVENMHITPGWERGHAKEASAEKKKEKEASAEKKKEKEVSKKQVQRNGLGLGLGLGLGMGSSSTLKQKKSS